MRDVYLRNDIRNQLQNLVDNPFHDDEYGDFFLPAQLDDATLDIIDVVERSDVYIRKPVFSIGDEVFYVQASHQIRKSTLSNYAWEAKTGSWTFYLQKGDIITDAVFRTHEAAEAYLRRKSK